jgi:hypothetical protein
MRPTTLAVLLAVALAFPLGSDTAPLWPKPVNEVRVS